MKINIIISILILIAYPILGQNPVRINSKVAYHAQNQLGEGAFWDSKRQKLWFVDIEKGEVHEFTPSNHSHKFRKTGQKIGTVVPTYPASDLILGLEDGIYVSSEEETPPQLLVRIPELKKPARLNDGKCDPQGRFWVGGLHPKEKGTSHLYRYQREGNTPVVKTILDSVSISNGICWSLNGKTMYYIDTPTRKVKAFDFEGNTGSISNGRTCIEIPDSLGWPDGMTMDSKGNLWIGMWGGFGVTSWSPGTGKLLARVLVPAPNVTSCAFGGPKMEDLFITTAREGLTSEQLKQYPNCGDLYVAKPGVKGIQMPYWNGR